MIPLHLTCSKRKGNLVPPGTVGSVVGMKACCTMMNDKLASMQVATLLAPANSSLCASLSSSTSSQQPPGDANRQTSIP
jgi:hypothetical protein